MLALKTEGEKLELSKYWLLDADGTVLHTCEFARQMYAYVEKWFGLLEDSGVCVEHSFCGQAFSDDEALYYKMPLKEWVDRISFRLGLPIRTKKFPQGVPA